MIYEVFRREREGAAMQHAGSIAAPDERFPVMRRELA